MMEEEVVLDRVLTYSSTCGQRMRRLEKNLGGSWRRGARGEWEGESPCAFLYGLSVIPKH